MQIPLTDIVNAIAHPTEVIGIGAVAYMLYDLRDRVARIESVFFDKEGIKSRHRHKNDPQN